MGNELALQEKIAELKGLTDFVNSLPVECDGASRLIHLALLRAKIEHKVLLGSVDYLGQVVCPHVWIEVIYDDAVIVIDYRVAEWVNLPPIVRAPPRGVFLKRDFYDRLTYNGSTIWFEISGCLALEKILGLAL